MRREIQIDAGIICGEDADIILKILPNLKECFSQRKSYYEYYYNSKILEVSDRELDILSNNFKLELYGGVIVINVNC